MSTEPTPAAEASTSNATERTVADKYRTARAELTKARYQLLLWLSGLVGAIANLAIHVAGFAADEVMTGQHDHSSTFWLGWAIIIIPVAILFYSGSVADHAQASHRKFLAEEAVLKEAAKPTTDKQE